MDRRRYALIGAGMRARMYTQAIAGPHADEAELVAIGDVNAGRSRHHSDLLIAAGSSAPRLFSPEELETVIADEAVDRVIVTAPDLLHAEYIVRALHAGADVVVEKPLTIDVEGCQAIAAAAEETGRDVVITFNYRYAPRNAELKRVIRSGEIGQVTSVHFEWVLDTKHGADYFRRWHRLKTNSGGLFVHKASHHFDLINWWIEGEPERVFASGGLRFYGPSNAQRRGLGARPPRGTGDGASADPFGLDLAADEVLKALYLDNEEIDGYLRDRDPFTGDITIEDNLAAIVDYDNGATLSYSLNAHAPWEGYTVVVNGTEGRAELTVVERGLVESDNHIDPSVSQAERRADDVRPVGESLVVQRHWGPAVAKVVPEANGGHGGGDGPLLRDIFHGVDPDDELGTAASWRDGIRAVSVGIAANLSLSEKRAVFIPELQLLGKGTLKRQ